MFDMIETTEETIQFTQFNDQTSKKIQAALSGLDNLLTIHEVISVEGLDGGMMAIINKDNQFLNIIGVTVEELTVEIATEGIIETTKKVFNWIVDKIMAMINKINSLIKKAFDFFRKASVVHTLSKDYDKKLVKYGDRVQIITIDREDFAKRQAFYQNLVTSIKVMLDTKITDIDYDQTKILTKLVTDTILTSKVKSIVLDHRTVTGFSVQPLLKADKDKFKSFLKSTWGDASYSELCKTDKIAQELLTQIRVVADYAEAITKQHDQEFNKLIIKYPNPNLPSVVKKIVLKKKELEVVQRLFQGVTTIFSNVLNDHNAYINMCTKLENKLEKLDEADDGLDDDDNKK